MNIELERDALFNLTHARTIAVGAALFLFLVHRLGLDPAEDVFEWLLVVVPALEISGVAWLFAALGDHDHPVDSAGSNWSGLASALRWFGFVVALNWAAALFIASTIEAYVALGGPAVYMPIM
ncbi:hypothetical protein QMT40_002401 [Parvibaculaceae bacterium PLY_AMNH_Bact1]|nr:hypothetical protein QMT40_002401 [Parvibaculaceae bacterium PLY_AMNH_Bact1]